ncbi:MAG: hypothetical protein D6721_05175 [Gammaproteobacteria bacterium]|nr:MAG: hypothetical protein D6721_05175 [Gammaproteobacteria bacterium]
MRTGMSRDHLGDRLTAYAAWKRQLLDALEAFRAWLEPYRPESGEDDLRLYETLEAVRRDRLRLAFVAEFSRGKTELINAIFFAGYGRRLLPSEAGRTTMCPCELFHDREADAPYVRLLPIETRADARTLAELREAPECWVHLPLDVQDPERMAETLREVVRTRRVPVAEARALGFPVSPTDGAGPEADTVEIPRWRHALISFPHPLLEHGLVLLDTPGLNALGSEPELTLQLLPSAQAVLFLLAADTGVTQSDLEMWNHHVRGAEGAAHGCRIVALNKIDVLWDELKEADEIAAILREQCRRAAEALGISPEGVFPVSAQKALVAKVRGDEALLERSGLPALERYLYQEVVPNRQRMLQAHVLGRLGPLIDGLRLELTGRLQRARQELEHLRALQGRNAEVLEQLLERSRTEQAAYLRSVESFQASRRLLRQQARELLAALDLQAFDRLIRQTRQAMQEAWTTRGLRQGMQHFFAGARDAMVQAADQAEQTRRLVLATYRKFHEAHGLPALEPRAFSVEPHLQALHRLMVEAEAFRNSPITAMLEQHVVVRRFFVTLVAQARALFFQAHQEAEAWLRDVMHPLVHQIKAHRQDMDRRLETLRRISASREALEERLQVLTQECRRCSTDLEALEALQARLAAPLPEGGAASTEAATA